MSESKERDSWQWIGIIVFGVVLGLLATRIIIWELAHETCPSCWQLYSVSHERPAEIDGEGRWIYVTGSDAATEGNYYRCRVSVAAYSQVDHLDLIKLRTSDCQRLAP